MCYTFVVYKLNKIEENENEIFNETHQATITELIWQNNLNYIN